MLRIHDTMAERARWSFDPACPAGCRCTSADPTVYDVPHVGHGRTAVVFDVIRRYLEWSGLAVTFVSNVTNVEDKIIARAASEGTSEREVARPLRAGVLGRSSTRLDVRRPDDVPRATEFIDQMVELIGELVAVGPRLRDRGRGRVLPGRRPTAATASCRAGGSTT